MSKVGLVASQKYMTDYRTDHHPSGSVQGFRGEQGSCPHGMHYWVRHASVGDRGAGRETRRLWNNPPNKYLLREGCHVLGTGYSSEQNERTAPPCGALPNEEDRQ